MKIQKYIKLTVFIALSLLTGMTGAQAQIANSACDPSYYESLEARAWLEAQREITQNQNLIAKPDSVLAYSCFDQFAFELAKATREMFSETDRWDSTSGSSLGRVAEPLIGASYGMHLINNFGHSFRGGRGQGKPNPKGSVSASNSNSYNCAVMGEVWEAAQCANFIERSHDGFFTLAEYTDGDDKRKLPRACGAIKGQLKNNYDRSGLNATPDTAVPWLSDDAKSYPQFKSTGECGDTPPVETGLTVKRGTRTAGASEFAEKICLQPGCYYDPENDQCASSL